MQLDDDVTSNGVIAPRFLDQIADEVDIIEDKKAPFREFLMNNYPNMDIYSSMILIELCLLRLKFPKKLRIKVKFKAKLC